MFIIVCWFAVLPISAQDEFVTTQDTHFVTAESLTPYPVVGMDMWYAPMLTGKGKWADKALLCAELDTLQAIGVKNIRVLAGAELFTINDGEDRASEYLNICSESEKTLSGLDYLLAELHHRKMKAVVCLSDTFPTDSTQLKTYHEFITRLLARVNKVSKQLYTEDNTILSWELAFNTVAEDATTLPEFSKNVIETAAIIKRLDNNHMVSVGATGIEGFGGRRDVYCKVMNSDEVDYLTFNLFPLEKHWVSRGNFISGASWVLVKTAEWLETYNRIALQINKPFVISGTNYPRDASFTLPSTPTSARAAFLGNMFLTFSDYQLRNEAFDGFFVSSWGGTPMDGTIEKKKKKENLYTTFPQSTRGLYPIFGNDKETLTVFRRHLLK